MKFNKSSIAIAIALLSSASAVSALDIGATQTPAQANRIPVTTQSTSAGSKNLISGRSVKFTIPATAAIDALQVGDVIELTISGGKFDGVNMAALATPLSVNNGATIGPLILDATHTKFSATVTAASTTGLPVEFTLQPLYDITGAAVDTEVDLTAKIRRFSSTVVAHEMSTSDPKVEELVITAAVAKITLGTAGTATSAVADSFLKFTPVAAVVTATTMTIPLTNGSVGVGDYRAVLGTATGKLFVKLTGLPLNTKKVTWTGIAAPANQVLADKSTAPTTATPDSAFYLPGDGNGYALITAAAVAAGLQDMKLTVDGVTPILPTDVKLEADYVAGAADVLKNHQILAPVTVAKIIRDGSSFTVNSSNKDNVIKITDMSGNIIAGTGDITVMAYDNVGAVVAGTFSITPLVSGGTSKILVKDLKTAYPTSVRYDFSIESSAIIASNVKRVKNAAGQTIGINVEKYSTAPINTL